VAGAVGVPGEQGVERAVEDRERARHPVCVRGGGHCLVLLESRS
jgi:hypothetical protein